MNLSKTILSTLLAASTLSFASAKLVGWAGQTFDEAERQQLEKMNRNSRLLALVKTLWPECTQWQYKNAFTCKDFIDNELAQMGYPEIDVVIVYRRNADSPTSNAMVILTDDDGICVGRDGDGLLHYDWDWCGAGYKLTNSVAIEESSKLIKPSRWTKMIEKNPNVSCENGVVIHDKSPNAFGGDFNINTCSTLAGYNKKVTALSQSVPMPAQGCRKIAPIDCSGKTWLFVLWWTYVIFITPLYFLFHHTQI